MYYTDDLASVREDMLQGFFVGWPRRPSAGQHLAVLRGSYRPWWRSMMPMTASRAL
jgi:hypothetical protein